MSPTSYQTAPSRDDKFNPFGAIELWCRGPESNRYDFKGRRILSPVRLPVPPPRHTLALRVGLEPTTYRLTAGCSAIELPKNRVGCVSQIIDLDCATSDLPKLSLDRLAKSFVWQLPTLPGRFQPSTIGVKRLNLCVRYGYRCLPLAIVTRRKLNLS